MKTEIPYTCDVTILDLKMEGMDALANGAFDYLSKPYDFEDLLLKIREAHRSGKDTP